MRDDEKIEFMMTTILASLQDALSDIGTAVLTDYENQMEQMSDEQKIEFLSSKLNNPYTELKKPLLTQEAEYEKFKADPIEQEKIKEMFEQLVDQLKNMTEEETSDDTEDDSTKH